MVTQKGWDAGGVDEHVVVCENTIEADEYIKLGGATREAWTHEQLREEFADLPAWCNQLYESFLTAV